MKTLAYFGCGMETMDFSDFHYDRIILIDYNLDIPNTIHKEVIGGKKIIKMACDAIYAISILKEEKIKLDCFVSINEGLHEGGGEYALNGSYFLSYLSPVLNDTYVHIYAPKYYSETNFKPLANKKKFINYSFHILGRIGIEKTGIIASRLNNGGNFPLKSYLMKRKNDDLVIDNPKLHFKLVHGNIWEYASNLDSLFLTINKSTSFFSCFEKIQCFKKGEFPFDKLEKAQKNGDKKIGIIPWCSKNYNEELKKIIEFTKKTGIEISLFYVDRSDHLFFENLFNNLITPAP